MVSRRMVSTSHNARTAPPQLQPRIIYYQMSVMLRDRAPGPHEKDKNVRRPEAAMLRLSSRAVTRRVPRLASERERKSQARPHTSSLAKVSPAKFYMHVTPTSLLTASSCHNQGPYLPSHSEWSKAWEHG